MSEWQPIEKVPMDGTEVEFYWPSELNTRTDGWVVSVGYVTSDDWWSVEGWTAGKLLDDMGIKPTMFRYIEPPEGAAFSKLHHSSFEDGSNYDPPPLTRS